MHDAIVEEHLHGSQTAQLRRTACVLPAGDAGPALAIERTTLPEGAHRPPVILVHGLAQNRFSWRLSRRSMSGWLARAGYEVLNLELRGHGNSRAAGAGNATGFSDYVADVARVAEACDTPPFAIGHSLGGAAIVGAATVTPMRGLVHLGGVFTFASDNRTLRALARLTLRWEGPLRRSPARLSTGWAGALIGRLYRLTDVAGYGLPLAGWTPGSLERDLLEERLARGFDWTSVEVWLDMCRWARGARFDYADAFSQVDVPLLVISGDHDMLARPADGRACFDASATEDREMVVLDAYEHQVHWGHVDLVLGRKAPEEVWPRITAWLDAR